MSVSIQWQPVNPKTNSLCAGCSTVQRALERAFGDFPITLDFRSEDTGKLIGLSAGWTGEDNPYDVLLEALRKHGSIILTTSF